MNTNDIIKKVLLHRQKVSNKLSMVANDLAIRGRRHDNSYTGGTELIVIEKILSDPSGSENYKQLLNSMHSNLNDYMPGFHDTVSDMNMLQLLELIADRISHVEETVENPTMEDYTNEVMKSLGEVSSDLQGVVKQTIDYLINRNECIKRVIEKSEKTKDALNKVTVSFTQDGDS